MAAPDVVFPWVYFVILCVISVVSLPTNSIVFIWKPSNPNDRLNFARLVQLLTSQALANLTTASVVTPLWLFILIMDQKKITPLNLSEINDICFHSFDLFQQLLASLHIVVIATERLIAIGWLVMHRTAPDQVYYIASIFPCLVASSVPSIITGAYYFTRTPVLLAVTSIGCFGIPCLFICTIFLVMTFKLFGRVLTPSTEIDSKIAKKRALVFLCYLVISFPYRTISVLKVFCSSCGLKKHSLSLGLRCLLCSSSAVIPVVLISSLPELRA